MKTRFMIKATGLFIAGMLVTNFVAAQVNHAVQVSNNKFEPKELSINVGDTVTWTNIEGNHNVDGKQAAYPGNPASFGNDVGSGWTYSYVFTIAGTYDYKCDPHVSFGMVGKIVVNGEATTSLSDNKASFKVSLYPNPVKSYLNISLNEELGSDFADITIYNVVGEKVMVIKEMKSENSNLSLDLNDLPTGLYIVNVSVGSEHVTTRFIKE